MKKSQLDAEIENVILFMRGITPDSDEYTAAANNLKTLYEARSKRRAFLIEPEIILTAAVNLVAIFVVIRHEEFNVISSQAMRWIFKK